MRLIRNIEGEPRPLIMHPRLFWVREADSFVRDLFCNILGRYSRRPRYMTAEQTPEQHARTLLACEAFMGAMSPEPRLARYYLERSRLGMLADPTVSEARKRELVAEGPRCVARRRGVRAGTCHHWTWGNREAGGRSRARSHAGRSRGCHRLAIHRLGETEPVLAQGAHEHTLIG